MRARAARHVSQRDGRLCAYAEFSGVMAEDGAIEAGALVEPREALKLMQVRVKLARTARTTM